MRGIDGFQEHVDRWKPTDSMLIPVSLEELENPPGVPSNRLVEDLQIVPSDLGSKHVVCRFRVAELRPDVGEVDAGNEAHSLVRRANGGLESIEEFGDDRIIFRRPLLSEIMIERSTENWNDPGVLTRTEHVLEENDLEFDGMF